MSDPGKLCIVWHRSTKSGGANCVEVAVLDGSVLIRDSVNPDGAMLKLSPAEWYTFLGKPGGRALECALPDASQPG